MYSIIRESFIRKIPNTVKYQSTVRYILSDVLQIVAERQVLKSPKNSQANGAGFVGSSGISNVSTTQQQIPKEHKFRVSNVASQHLAIFSHTAGISADSISPLPPCPDKLGLEVIK